MKHYLRIKNEKEIEEEAPLTLMKIKDEVWWNCSSCKTIFESDDEILYRETKEGTEERCPLLVGFWKKRVCSQQLRYGDPDYFLKNYVFLTS